MSGCGGTVSAIRQTTFYDEHPFDWIERYDAREVDAVISPLLLSFVESLSPEDRVLDIGCGPGRVMSYLESRGLQCAGFDRSEQSLRLMRGRLRKPAAVADNLHLPVKSGAADAVISDGVLHHTPDPYRSFLENCRILCPGGRLYLAVYKPGGRYEFLYRFPGSVFRAAMRLRLTRALVHFTALPIYYAVHLLRRRGRISWRGATNLFYDYFISPRVAFLSRDTIQGWCKIHGIDVLTYDRNPRGNVHSFILQKPCNPDSSNP